MKRLNQRSRRSGLNKYILATTGYLTSTFIRIDPVCFSPWVAQTFFLLLFSISRSDGRWNSTLAPVRHSIFVVFFLFVTARASFFFSIPFNWNDSESTLAHTQHSTHVGNLVLHYGMWWWCKSKTSWKRERRRRRRTDGGESASERASDIELFKPCRVRKKMQSRRGIHQFHYWLGMWKASN